MAVALAADSSLLARRAYASCSTHVIAATITVTVKYTIQSASDQKPRRWSMAKQPSPCAPKTTESTVPVMAKSTPRNIMSETGVLLMKRLYAMFYARVTRRAMSAQRVILSGEASTP